MPFPQKGGWARDWAGREYDLSNRPIKLNAESKFALFWVAPVLYDIPAPRLMHRRDAIKAGAIYAAAVALGRPTIDQAPGHIAKPMKLTCIIRYQIDPFQRDDFRKYCENWGKIIPKCGGYLIGYFLPSEGTNDIAWGLIAFDTLAAYEAFRARLKSDPDGRANLAFAQSKKLILREERNFVENVEGTIGIPPQL